MPNNSYLRKYYGFDSETSPKYTVFLGALRKKYELHSQKYIKIQLDITLSEAYKNQSG